MKRVIILSGILYLLASSLASAEVSVGINFGFPSEPTYIEEEPSPTYVPTYIAPPAYPAYYRHRHYHHRPHERHFREERHEGPHHHH